MSIVSLFLSLVTLTIASQADFDRLPSLLSQALKGEEDIEVVFEPGAYYYQEKHLEINGVRRPGLRLSFHCDGVVFLPVAGPEKGWSDAFSNPVTHAPLEVFTPLKQVLRRPEIRNAGTGLCRVRADEGYVSERNANDMYLVLTQWYQSRVYKVVKIERGYIYFQADKVTSDGSPEYDPDSDYRYGRVLPRYVLVKPSSAPAEAYRGTASRFLTVLDCSLKSFTLTGARFVGNGGKDCLIQFYKVVSDGIELSGCSFEHIHGNTVQVQYTGHFSFRENRLTGLWKTGLIIDYFSPGAVVTGNRFDDTGLLMAQDFCIIARGSDFRITDNVFRNFTYGAIGIGTHWREPIPASSSGIVERNELYCTDSFNRYLMDSGAIYTWTSNRDVTIRYNYIHDIGGYRDNRGIFCDDGTVNVKILDNRILRIKNSWCIDLRRVASVERDSRSYVKKTNVGNQLSGNDVDGRIRFVNRD